LLLNTFEPLTDLRETFLSSPGWFALWDGDHRLAGSAQTVASENFACRKDFSQKECFLMSNDSFHLPALPKSGQEKQIPRQ
jgi:hypothetical protein